MYCCVLLISHLSLFLQGVEFITKAVACFGESAPVEEECALLRDLGLWWMSMLDASILQHPVALCAAVNGLRTHLKGPKQLPRSKIKSGLLEEVCVCVCLYAYICSIIMVRALPCSSIPNLKKR